MPDDGYTLLLSNTYGLANRLRAILSAVVVARAHRKTPLYVHWTACPHCPAEPSQLFDLAYAATAGLQFVPVERYAELAQRIVDVVHLGQEYAAANPAAFGSRHPDGQKRHHDEYAVCVRIPDWWHPSLRWRAEQTMAGASPVLGVHVRRTDLHAVRRRKAEADQVLFGEVDRRLAERDGDLYVATDNPESLQQFVARYASQRRRVIRADYPWRAHGIRLSGPTDALVDALCLSQCPLIVGTFGSSFSKFAAELGGRRLIAPELPLPEQPR